MKVHHFSAASMCPAGARLVNGEGGWFARGRLVCHCWLIESNDGLILVDTGIGTADLTDLSHRMGPWFGIVVRPELGEEHTAIAQVRRLGFKPEDVRHIIPTHLDLDHAGGMPDFPTAQVHVFRPEYDAAMARATLKDAARYRPEHWKHGPKWDLRAVEGEPWFGFQRVQALDGQEEVLLIPLIGHTRGHCGVALKTADGWLLHAGDAYFFHGEMARKPSCPPALVAFQRLVATLEPERTHNAARLRTLVAEQPEVEIHSAHCPFELDRFSSVSG